jgi:hypothetical protein
MFLLTALLNVFFGIEKRTCIGIPSVVGDMWYLMRKGNWVTVFPDENSASIIFRLHNRSDFVNLKVIV